MKEATATAIEKFARAVTMALNEVDGLGRLAVKKVELAESDLVDALGEENLT